MENLNLLKIRHAEFILDSAKDLVKNSEKKVSLAKDAKGFGPQSEHDIVLKNIERFLKDIEFVYTMNGMDVVS